MAMNARSYPVNRATANAYAKVIANKKYKMHELPKKDRLTFSDGWLTDLFKRIGVKSRRYLYGEHSSVDLTSANIVAELKKIEKLLEPYDPRDILNFDEIRIYYEQQPTRTICEKPMGGSKKSKNRFTTGLLTNYDGSYKGHPIVIGRKKTPKAATKKLALYRRITCIGQSHYVEYHSSPSAWMTTEVFRKYIKRLNSSSIYAKRKVAILVDKASVHKLTEEFSNIKLIFLPANTTSKLQPLDAVRRFNEIIPDFPGNRDDDGNLLATALEGLDLAADESDLIVFRPEFVEFSKDNGGEDREKPATLEEEELVDVKEIREKLKQSYEYHSFAIDDQDRFMLKTIRKKLDEIRSEEVDEKKQTTLCNYFSAI